jgi:hypothetical protein
MEWLLAGGFALLMLIWSAIYLVKKLLRFRPIVLKLALQLEAISEASAKAPEVVKLMTVINDDPVLHVARRLELQRKARRLKRQRERRLSSRVFESR